MIEDESIHTADDSNYQDQLGVVLRKREVAALREFLTVSAARYGHGECGSHIASLADEQLHLMMHRMILARRDLADLRPASPAACGSRPARRWTREAD